MIELLWPNGDCTRGETWAAVEAAVRAAQPVPFPTRREFRREMRRRASLWSGHPCKTPVVPESSEAFLRSLAGHNMFMIVTEKGRTP